MTGPSAQVQASALVRWLKRIGLALVIVIALAGSAAGLYAYQSVSAYDASLSKVYQVALVPFERSTDPAVIARGKHLADSLAGCALADCHGSSLGGGRLISAGPVGTFGAPNITPGGVVASYTDAELARTIRHGIKKNGRGVQLMPIQDWNWLPKDDITAIVSYVRSVPPVEGPGASMLVGVLGKVLDLRDEFILDVARRVDHAKLDQVRAPAPAPTAEYGQYVAKLCTGCHGETFAGGPLPGAPPDMSVPLNLTPHATGLAGWTYDEFVGVMETGVRKDGKTLDAFMPREAINNMNEDERRALWAYLVSLPPKAFGER
jgi:hypothetical protein